jgi:hypothetical protein
MKKRISSRFKLCWRPTITVLAGFTFAVSNLQADENPAQAYETLAGHLLGQEFDKATLLAKNLADATGSDDSRNIKRSIDAVAAMPGILLASFAAQKDTVVTMNLGEKKERLRIKEVRDNGTIRADILVFIDGREAGTIARDFRMEDVDPVEKYRRLGEDPSPERKIMRGLLAHEYGNREVALRFFAEAGPPLGPLLTAQVQVLMKAEQEAAQARQIALHEASLRKVYEEMLRAAGLPPETDADAAATALRKTALNERQITQIDRLMQRFRDLKGKTAATEFEKRHAEVIGALGSLTPGVPLEISPKALKQALDTLARKHPKEILQAKHQFTEDGIILDLSKHRAISDISSLAGLRIVELNLSGTAVADLTPLRGMPLRNLNISGTQVVDLDPLQRMPIHVLNISHTKIGNLQPISGLPIEKLDLHACLNLTDIRLLQGLPLKELRVGGHVHITDLTPLQGMPLKRLDLNYATKIRDISPRARGASATPEALKRPRDQLYSSVERPEESNGIQSRDPRRA